MFDLGTLNIKNIKYYTNADNAIINIALTLWETIMLNIIMSYIMVSNGVNS